MRAYCLIRDEPVYRTQAFCSGLKKVGFEVSRGFPNKGAPGDVLLLWNRYAERHDLATRFESEGGTVLVAENAFLGVDRSDRRRYAMAQGAHNGAGFWHVGGPERWAQLGIDLKPWRKDGDHILVCPNRSFGMPGFIMPANWVVEMTNRLQRVTSRRIKVRPHPGNNLPKVPLAEDLKNAWAVVIWSSSAGVDALVAGIPVYCEAPWWICKSATRGIREIEKPLDGINRLPAMQALAWAQWSVEEIEAGEPFVHLLNRPCAFGGGL